MIPLRLHQELYSGHALDETLEVYKEHASFARREHAPYFEVEITASEGDEAELAGEVGNYALALTIEERRTGGR